MKDLLANHAPSIAIVVFGAIGAYFMLQAHDDQIKALQVKDIELEAHKVGNSTMILKDQATDASFLRVDEEIDDIIGKLNKKSMLISALQSQIHLMAVQVAVQQAQINQGIGERGNMWQNYNRINCK